MSSRKLKSVLFVYIAALFWLLSDVKAASFNQLPELSSDPKIAALTKSVVVLYERGTRFGITNFCSGAIINYRGQILLQTAAHCIPNQEKCSRTNIVRNYHNSYFKDESTILNSGHAIEHECLKPVFVDEHLDLAYLEISEPLNSRHKNAELTSIPFTISETSVDQESVFILGHPAGDRLTISNQCHKAEVSAYARFGNQFIMSHDCITIGGSSGSPIFRSSDYSLIGVVVSGNTIEGESGNKTQDILHFLNHEKIGKGVYLPLLINELRKILSGMKVGIFAGFNESTFLVPHCPNTIELKTHHRSVENGSSVSRKRLMSRIGLLIQKNPMCTKQSRFGGYIPIEIAFEMDISDEPTRIRLSDRIISDGMNDQQLLERILSQAEEYF